VFRLQLLLVAGVLFFSTLLAGAPVQAAAPHVPDEGDVSAASAPLPPIRYADVLTKYRLYNDWYRSLLDPTYRLSSSYAPSDLVSTYYAGLNGGYYVRRHVLYDLKAMAAAARAAGAPIAVQSGYRSYGTQKRTFDYWVSQLGYSEALRVSARPGHSEHQLGTSLDFRSATSTRAPWDYYDWSTTKAGYWMKLNAWRYGFVMSYPKGKYWKTGYDYEPWHYRYVGRARAKAIRYSGLTPREWFWYHDGY
jgi:zinc D-Ala-D-Ala carboxypeptidase